MSVELKRRLARMVWIEVGKAINPYLAQVMSDTSGLVEERWNAWNRNQLSITRSLFRVVFEGAEPDDALLTTALDFLGVQ